MGGSSADSVDAERMRKQQVSVVSIIGESFWGLHADAVLRLLMGGIGAGGRTLTSRKDRRVGSLRH